MVGNSLSRAQFGHLTKHFFGRFFDSELIATPHTEMHLTFVQMLALLVLPGLFRTIVSVSKYSALAWFPVIWRDRAVLIDSYFFLCLSMILTGFVTVFEWDALFPDHKEYYNLTPLPIKPETIFFAKVTALLLFVVLFNVAINGLSTLLYPGSVYVWSCKPGTAGTTLRNGQGTIHLIGHAASLFAGSIFVFTSLVAIRSVFLLVLPAKMARMASRCLQLLLILIFLCALFIFPALRVEQLVKEGHRVIYLLPPFWFLGMYQMMINHHTAVYGSLARMAFKAVSFSCSLAVISYIISYRSSMLKGFQSAGLVSHSTSFLKRLAHRVMHRILLRNSVERAAFHFAAKTICRRQEHLLYIGSFIAVGIALICLGTFILKSGYVLDSSHHLNVLLSFPLIMSFFVLVGLRIAFSVPADLNANWIFKVIETSDLKIACRGIYKFMLCAAGFTLAVFLPFYMAIWDARLVVLHVCYVGMLSLILIEALLFRFQKMPFTCSYLPGKTNIKLFWPAYVLACIFYSYGTTVLERWMFEDIRRLIVFIAVAGTVMVALNRDRSSFMRKIAAIRFEEEPPEQLNLLNLLDTEPSSNVAPALPHLLRNQSPYR